MTVLAAVVAVLLSTDAPPGTYRVRTATCPACEKDELVKAMVAPKSFNCGVGTERDFLKANKVFKCVLEKAKGKKPFHSVFERATVSSIERFHLLRDGKGALRFVALTKGPCGDRVTSNVCKAFKKQDALYPACFKKGKTEELCTGTEVETFSEPRPLSELRCEWAGGDKGRKCKVGTSGGVEPLPDQTAVCTPEMKCDLAVKKP